MQDLAPPNGTPASPEQTQAEARRDGRKNLLRGTVAVGACLGVVVLAAALGWGSAVLFGPVLIVGWADFGFGACEAVFGQKLRIVKLLLTVLFMIFGVSFSFWVISALGFKLSGS